MKLGLKLSLGFAVSTVFLIVVVIFSIFNLNKLNDSVQILSFDCYPKTVWSHNVIEGIYEASEAIKNIMLTNDDSEIDRNKKHLDEIKQLVSNSLDSLKKVLTFGKGKELLDNVLTARKEYMNNREKLFSLVNSKEIEQAKTTLFGNMRSSQNEYIVAINNLIQYQDERFINASIEGDEIYHSSFLIQIIIAIISLLASIITAFVITRMITKPISRAVNASDSISKGDLNVDLTSSSKDETGHLLSAMKAMSNTINDLVKELNMVAAAATEGKLDKRANEAAFEGEYKSIMKGFNNTLDAVIGPLNVTAEYVDRISKGDIPPKITDEYKGDFNEIKNNLNQCIDAVNLLVVETGFLAKAAADGKLQTRADASKHNGDFREIVEGVNQTLDGVINPLNEAAEVLKQMATGDLTVRMMGSYKGDMEAFKEDINTLGDSLAQLITQVNDAVQSSASSAVEISATAESLAAASQEQSAQADEVASAVEEMSRTVTENAMSANRTADVARANGQVANEGAGVVKQTVTKMRDIADVVKNSAMNIQKLGDSSKQIGEIISVIDDIADQTNLLALNAAIEAARAGEQGRGFAVVADEVRKLAERTTEATKQIASMIKGIQSETELAVQAMNKGTHEVQSGIELADRAGESLNNILTSTQEVLDMINQIAAASEQQSATSEQISKNVMSISKVTGESAQRIEDVAKTSDELAKMTEHLRELMGQFQVEEETTNKGFNTRHLSHSPKKQLGSRLR